MSCNLNAAACTQILVLQAWAACDLTVLELTKLAHLTKLMEHEDLSMSQTIVIDYEMSCSRSEINDARLESLDRSFEDPEHPTLGTRLDRR